MKKRIYLWGTGKLACQVMDELLPYIESKYDIEGVIDNRAVDDSALFYGYRVYSPGVLKEYKNEWIVILTWACDEISRQIQDEYSVSRENIKGKFFFYEELVFARYQNTHDQEIQQVLGFIKKNGARFINYDFVHEYEQMQVSVEFDDSCGMFYVIHNGKRMYMSKNFTDREKVIDYYKGICTEQDIRSPHRYLAESFCVEEGDIVVDAGVAEGNFALDIIERAKKIYLIEADKDWIEALRMTFRDYGDKVIIVEKFLSSVDDGIYASLDSIIDEHVDFIKMDIEGNEWEAIKGGKKILKDSGRMKMAVCVYHTDWDENLIRNELSGYGFDMETTPGYLWFPYYASNRLVSTMLHRGVIRAKRGDADEN